MYCNNDSVQLRAGDKCFVGCSKGTCLILLYKDLFGPFGIFLYLCSMIRSSRTYVADLKPRHLRKVCELTLSWCVKTMGFKKYKGTPTLRVSLAKVESEDCYGYYCPFLNEIVLYKETIKDCTVRKVIMVIIHEYTHSLQKIRKSYGKMYDKFGYWKHPMEIEARMSESTWNICYKDIKGDLLK